jgi:Domain of Unknown Function with PDB structure (DUF3857)
MNIRSVALIPLFLSSALACLGETPIDVGWLPVTDAQRNMKAPVVEKDAGVEALFWNVHVRDEIMGGQDIRRVFYHYVRLKIFDEKGKEKASTIDIPFNENTSIMFVKGRTIKADGAELLLRGDSVYERDLVRVGRTRLKVKSFAMPGVEPGAIVEYRWQELRNDPAIRYARLQFQREFPVQKVTYFIRPLPRDYVSSSMSIWPFNCRPSALKRENDGFESTSLENVPAFREEPMMPGEPNVRPWALIYYREDEKRREPDKYWNDTGKDLYNRQLKPALKANDEVKQAAAGAIEGATGDEQKVLALVKYIRKNLRNLFSAQVTEAERAKILKQMPKDRERTSSEIFKQGIGTSDELNTLFAAMATSVGLDARPAMVADREDMIFTPSMTDRYFLRSIDMAVNIGGTWKLYDVSAHLLPANMLSWREEGMQALIGDSKKPVFVAAPLSPPDASAAIRTAQLALLEDGSIEGDVDQQYSGHLALDRRSEMKDDTEARRLERLKEQTAKVFPDAEISDLRIENVDDPEKPMKLHYHFKMAGYAQRTGKRLLVHPLFFQRGVPPLFASTERRHPIIFPYGWQERDTVSIVMPDGFVLDNAENPGGINFGAPGSYELKMSIKGGRELICTRELTFGKEGRLAYPQDTYPTLKTLFDTVHRHDDAAISFKQGAAAVKQP